MDRKILLLLLVGGFCEVHTSETGGAEVVPASREDDVSIFPILATLPIPDFNFGNIYDTVVEQKKLNPITPPLLFYDKGTRELIMKVEGTTKVHFTWNCSAEEDVTIELLYPLLNRYLLEKDKKVAERTLDCLAWAEWQVGFRLFDSKQSIKPMSLKDGVSLLEECFIAMDTHGIVPYFREERKGGVLKASSIPAGLWDGPSAALNAAATVSKGRRVSFNENVEVRSVEPRTVKPRIPKKTFTVFLIRELSRIEGVLKASGTEVIATWFNQHRAFIIENGLGAFVDEGKIQFDTGEDLLVVPFVLEGISPEVVEDVCETLNGVVGVYHDLFTLSGSAEYL